MFKPLLRTLPSLSGNMKIICFLDNYNNLEDHIFEANVRSARLSPISSQLFTKYINLSLLKSTYEWDVKNFYTKYSDYFYKALFDVNKNDLNIYDEYGINKNRNTDFEYGLKRISYQKNGKQFAFFAPIYIESLEDVPDYFEIKIEITNANYKTSRTIRVNVGKENKGNFLGSYIKEYAKNIDDNIVYLNKDDYEGIYYGIDVSTGGLTKKHDYRLQSIFTKQNSILNFDNIIAKGFERNTLIMKQILPLCFYFSLNDILSDVEKTMFYDAELDISGKWIKDNKEVLLNDFDLNYTKLTPQIPMLNTETGAMDLRIPGNYNIMNMGYPSMKEASFYKYSFSNKITANFCRWRLKYSSDEEPYIANMSAAFSFYQGSKTKYGQFPNLYETLVGIVSAKPFNLNLFLPLNGAEAKYPISTIEKYNKIRANFGSEWFEPFIDIDDALSRCEDVRDNKVYFDGILYNLSNIYDSITSTSRIDKFGVFIRPKFHFITDEMIRDGKIVYSDYTIIKENSKYLVNKSPNCHVNDDMLTDENPRLFSNLTTNVKQDLLEVNNIFVRNEEDDGDFICLSDYGIDMYKANSFARLEDLESRLEEDLYSYIYRNSTNGFEILPIYRLSNVLDKSNTLSAYYSYANKLYISDGVNSTAKLPIEEDMQFSKVDKYALNGKSFYREGTFIDKEIAKNLIKEAYIGKVAQMYPGATSSSALQYIKEYSDEAIRNSIDAVSSYTFNPVLMNNGGEVYAAKVFKSDYSLSPRFFGDEIKYADDVCYTYMFDNDFIYVDPYNLNNIISHYNTTWLKNDESLSYYCLPTFEKDLLIFNMNTITDISDEWTYVDYDDEPDEEGMVILNPTIPPKKAQSSEIVGHLAERFFKKVIVPITTDIRHYYLGFEITSRFSFPEMYFGKRKKLTLVTSSIPPQTSIKAIEDIYESADKVKINGKRYNRYLLDAVLEFLNGTAGTSDSLVEPVKQLKQYMFAELNIHKNVFKSPSTFIMMDDLNTKTFNIKFLNKHHVGYYLKKLYLTNPSEFNSMDGFSYINNIFIRKRMVDENLCMKDIYTRLTDLISFGELTEEQSIKFLLENIDYDESSKLFYFNNLKEKNGKIYKINSKEEIKSKMFIGNINDLYNENGEFDPSKLKFELLFTKQMLRVDDNIWRLINLEEKYAAPYKDLYIYEFEKEHEYNKNLFISYNIVEPETPNVATLESVPGCLKPMFNLVRIETKEESQIYCEYSLNNITKSHIEDDLIFDRFEEHVYDKSRYFYRHNCNNKICMYDLSTMNRNVPIDIAGEKYVFRSDYPEETSYKYFHDTFDLFTKNEIEFANYAYTYTYNVTLDEVLKTRNELIEIKGSYNTVAFKENFEDIYANFRGNGIDEDGNYIYGEYHHEDHNPSLAYSYSVTLSYIPGSKPLFRMTSYAYVAVEYYESEIGDKLGFTYYDDINLYDKFNISTYEYDGTTYGFYLIDANINNTVNSLKVVSEDGDKLKYVSYINSVQLSENSEDDIKHIYKQLTPFVKNNPLRYFMANCSTIMKPSVLSIPLDYHPVEVNENGMSYYDIIFDKEKFGNITLERYFDSIAPIIKEQGVVNTYNLKYKDVKKSFKPTYLTNETIYKDEMSIVHYPGVRVYDMDDYSKYSLRKDIEYKHFNDNRMINLKESMNYLYDDYMTFGELQIAKSHTRVYEVFRELMLKHMYSVLDEKMIEWAFTKYSIEFGYQGVKLDPTQTEKLYKLEINFKLY